MSQCEQHMALKQLGTTFVSTVTRLMELLLEYRNDSRLFSLFYSFRKGGVGCTKNPLRCEF